MSFVHGKNSRASLDNPAGSLVPIHTFMDSIEGLPGEIELSDVTVFGDEGHKNVPGLENASISVSGHYDGAVSAIVDIIGTTAQRKAATRTFEYGPGGSGTGAIKYSAEVWIQAFTVSSSVTDKVSWSATLQVDGVVTQSTYA
jgi:hypothetical protein